LSNLLYTVISGCTHGLGWFSHSSGRLMPGCGQAGQNKARSPNPGVLFKSWPYPNLFLVWRSRHCLETLINSLYLS
jgi:hypothetical protein